jgi:ribosomal protein L37AE/L43A
MKKLNKQVERIEDRLRDEIDKLAEQYRQSHVIPFCNRRNLKFIAGMGGWAFFDTKGEVFGGFFYPDSTGLPKTLVAVLDTDVYMGQQCLGSLMQNYTPPLYKEPL